jgi:hypothetical protein
VAVGQGKRRKQLLNDVNEMRRYLRLTEEAPNCTLENSFWKKLCVCLKTDYGMNETVPNSRILTTFLGVGVGNFIYRSY